MLVDGVTINVGGDGPVGSCEAAISVDNSITGMHSKTIEASRRLVMKANMDAGTKSAQYCLSGP